MFMHVCMTVWLINSDSLLSANLEFDCHTDVFSIDDILNIIYGSTLTSLASINRVSWWDAGLLS